VSLTDAISLYLKTLESRGYGPRTAEAYGLNLRAFAAWAETLGIDSVADVDLATLREYRTSLVSRITRYGRPLALNTQSQRITALKVFFADLLRRGAILVDPARDLEHPRLAPRSAPLAVPTIREMARILAMPDTRTLAGIRDRALMELLYATGLRNKELRDLKVWDVDLEDRCVTVRRGKGQRGRVVPLGRAARRWVSRYLESVRPRWARRPSVDALFLTSAGGPLDGSSLNALVRLHARRAGLRKRVTPHQFRHACATHMLQNGADIRHLQQLLGHRSLTSTAIYTHLVLRDLQRTHRRYHPRAGKRLAARRPRR
jgi:integrase/recombinase XerD